jgi:ATP-dependent exoDNAse (exonuclease V) beta subunit
MVIAQNNLFCGASQPWLFYLPAKNRYLSAPEASCGKMESVSSTHDRKAVHFMVFEGELGRRRRWPHDEMENQQIFPWIADEIVRLHAQEVPLPEIAVLVKDRFQAKHLLDFLQTRNIPATSWKVSSVLDSPAYIWLQQALSLAATPEDRNKLCSLYLCSGANRFTHISKMIAVGRLDRWASAVHEWKMVHDAFIKRGVGGFSRALFACLLDENVSVHEYFSELENGDQFITDLEHLLELLSRIETALPHSLEAFSEAFPQLAERFSDDPSILLRRVDPSRRGITLVTMHASKGLEFPYVFALGCASRSPQNEVRNSDESDSEKFRLLYVSVTRAKKRCYLPIMLEKGGKIPEFGRASPIELMAAAFTQTGFPGGVWQSNLYGSVSADSLEKFYRTLVEGTPDIFSFSIPEKTSLGLSLDLEKRDAACIVPFSRILSSSIRYCSFTSSRKKTGLLKRHEKNFQEMPAVRFGVLFHEAMAKLLQEPIKTRSSIVLIEAFLEKIGLQDALLADLLYRSVHVDLPLQDEHICLADIPNEQMRVECSFMDIKEKDSYQSGVIDLVIFRRKQAYIIDWKTQEVEQDCKEYFYDAGYDVQAGMYFEAVRKAFFTEKPKVFFVFVRYLDHGGIVACP